MTLKLNTDYYPSFKAAMWKLCLYWQLKLDGGRIQECEASRLEDNLILTFIHLELVLDQLVKHLHARDAVIQDVQLITVHSECDWVLEHSRLLTRTADGSQQSGAVR